MVHSSEKILAENKRLKEQVDVLKKEARDREWGIEKTNEGIKLLYKELERQNDELQQLDRLKSEFVSTVSHELRTPMTIIRESISQVNDGLSGEVNVEQSQLLDMALRNIERLSRIINNLLDISKLEAGKCELIVEPFDLVQLAHEVSEGFRFQFEKKGLELNVEPENKKVLINADRDKLIQVLTNLIGNAAKFTIDGGVTIQINTRPEGVLCSVRDTGPGMDADQVQKCFNKFQQFGRQTGGGEKGTGLGLAICKGIIDLHKGEIWVESEVDKGTNFIFTIPYQKG